MSKVQFDIRGRVVRTPAASTMTLEQAVTIEDFINRGGVERFPPLTSEILQREPEQDEREDEERRQDPERWDGQS